MNDLSKLVEKLRRIEALYSGAATPGEQKAAYNARERIKQKIEQCRETDPPVEYKFTLPDTWSRMLLVALLRRYDIKPYRYHRQRYTTVMARISKTFVDETLWPEFEELSQELMTHLNNITEKTISEAIYGDSSEPEEVKAISG